MNVDKMKYLLILHSYHHNNTRKIAEVIANEMNADIVNAVDLDVSVIEDYDCIGFGVGIDSRKHYK